jgi:hypothetical protein
MYQVAPDALLQSGMEAEVYAYSPDAVLKLYPGTASLADLRTLQDFYSTLDRRPVPYELPQIELVAQEAECCVTIEKRLPGRPMSSVLPALTSSALDAMMQRYLTAALASNRSAAEHRLSLLPGLLPIVNPYHQI